MHSFTTYDKWSDQAYIDTHTGAIQSHYSLRLAPINFLTCGMEYGMAVNLQDW